MHNFCGNSGTQQVLVPTPWGTRIYLYLMMMIPGGPTRVRVRGPGGRLRASRFASRHFDYIIKSNHVNAYDYGDGDGCVLCSGLLRLRTVLCLRST